MKIATVVLTTDRSPKHNYLGATLQGLIDSGLCEDERFTLDIFHTGQNRSNIDSDLLIKSNATLITKSKKQDFNLAFSNALSLAASRDADYVMLLEDDVLVATSFPDFVCCQLQLDPGAPLFDFVTYYREVTDAFLAGERIIWLDADGFYGTQCFCMPTKHAKSYSDFVLANDSVKPGYADTWFNFWLKEEGLPVMVATSVPCAAQHIGRDSNQGHEYIITESFKDDIEHLVPVPTTQYARHESVSDGFYLYNLESKEPLHLNSSAQLIYLYCDGSHTIADIESEIFMHTDWERVELNQQIRQCIAMLIEHNAVVYSPRT